MSQSLPIRIAVLVSGHGRGSNLQALLVGCDRGEINGTIVVVIGTRSDAPALQLSQKAGADTKVVSPTNYVDDEEAYGCKILSILKGFEVDLICLAGYMRVLPLSIVQEYSGRILNIHPSLLPKFGGKGMFGENVHKAVIESGDTVSGCTVHFVDAGYDTGPIALQSTVTVDPNDTPTSLAARVLVAEHETYVKAVSLYANGKLLPPSK